MNGLKLAAPAKARRPEMNIIIVTGYRAPKNDEIPPGSKTVQCPKDDRGSTAFPITAPAEVDTLSPRGRWVVAATSRSSRREDRPASAYKILTAPRGDSNAAAAALILAKLRKSKRLQEPRKAVLAVEPQVHRHALARSQEGKFIPHRRCH